MSPLWRMARLHHFGLYSSNEVTSSADCVESAACVYIGYPSGTARHCEQWRLGDRVGVVAPEVECGMDRLGRRCAGRDADATGGVEPAVARAAVRSGVPIARPGEPVLSRVR